MSEKKTESKEDPMKGLQAFWNERDEQLMEESRARTAVLKKQLEDADLPRQIAHDEAYIGYLAALNEGNARIAVASERQAAALEAIAQALTKG